MHPDVRLCVPWQPVRARRVEPGTCHAADDDVTCAVWPRRGVVWRVRSPENRDDGARARAPPRPTPPGLPSARGRQSPDGRLAVGGPGAACLLEQRGVNPGRDGQRRRARQARPGERRSHTPSKRCFHADTWLLVRAEPSSSDRPRGQR